MKTVIAVKAIGKTPKGGITRLPDAIARAMVAIGHAAYAPDPVKVKTKITRQYQRRDMVAEPAAPPRITGTITTPAARVYVPAAPNFYKPPVDDGKA